mgnify:CR=1 FL=1
MNLIKCPNNHLYNADHFSSCPHCTNTEAAELSDSTDGLDQANINTSPVERTIDELNDAANSSIAGWLVCIEGSEYGNYYPIYSGTNAIGRGANMDIRITSDIEISRQVHAKIIYNADTNIYTLYINDNVNPVYINGNIVSNDTAEPVTLNDRDRLTIGTNTFIFSAFCKEDFSWR